MMPEIKVKHVVSFSSEDKVHKAENLTKPETYRKWKCATPGEKSANVVLQFEKATQIHSIDIGNESSAFVEVLVGRSSDVVSNFQVLLVASSFMSPLESRNGTHGNRVRMFGPEKLSQNVKDEKWDCVQVICTQPFNKNVNYGLTFVKFHSPPEKVEEQPRTTEMRKAPAKIGPFKIKYDDDDEENEDLPSVGSWFDMKKTESSGNSNSSSFVDEPSYATAVLASKDKAAKVSPQNNTPKRKTKEDIESEEPPTKKPATSTLNKDHIVYKDVLDMEIDNKNNKGRKEDASKISENKRSAKATSNSDKPSTSAKQANVKKKIPFNKLMEKVVFVLSGFVNPLRSQLRDKALDMGAKYKADWDSNCTHLICAFINTPKYAQVSKLKGKIVSKDWIFDCYKKKELLPWKKYVLRQPDDSSEESEAQFTEESEDDINFSEELDESEDEEYSVGKKKNTAKIEKICKKIKTITAPSQKNKVSSPKADNTKKKNDMTTSKKESVFGILNPGRKAHSSTPSPSPPAQIDDSETEDEDALADYMAKTDVDSDSGGNTEDEMCKFEERSQKSKKGTPTKGVNGIKSKTELSEKPDVSDLPLPELLNIFKQKHFFLYGDFNSSKQHDLQRYIIAYNGVLEDYMSDKIKYVITEKKWDKDFDDALSENEDLIFVKPTWIYKCHDAGKLVPYQPYIIIPDS